MAQSLLWPLELWIKHGIHGSDPLSSKTSSNWRARRSAANSPGELSRSRAVAQFSDDLLMSSSIWAFPEIAVPLNHSIIHFRRSFHYKQTILGYPQLWKPPYTKMEMCYLWVCFVALAYASCLPAGLLSSHYPLYKARQLLDPGVLTHQLALPKSVGYTNMQWLGTSNLPQLAVHFHIPRFWRVRQDGIETTNNFGVS